MWRNEVAIPAPRRREYQLRDQASIDATTHSTTARNPMIPMRTISANTCAGPLK